MRCPTTSRLPRVTRPRKTRAKAVGGTRLTILAKKNRYRVNEEVRIIHVLEVVEPGHRLFVMGPKPIYGEYIDGQPGDAGRSP